MMIKNFFDTKTKMLYLSKSILKTLNLVRNDVIDMNYLVSGLLRKSGFQKNKAHKASLFLLQNSKLFTFFNAFWIRFDLVRCVCVDILFGRSF